MNTLFCRHNRFTVECPICSKDSVLANQPPERARPVRSASGGSRAPRRSAAAAATVTRYPHASVGPFDREGRVYEVRLEKVPGGLRLGEWRGGELERVAPVLPASGLRALAVEAGERGLVSLDDLPVAEMPVAKGTAASAGRAGDLREELRVERLPEPGLVRIARWLYWPGGGVGWELQDAPVLLPEQRFAEALGEAARLGLI